LEEMVAILQLGQGLFTASLDDKEAVYRAIGALDSYASNNFLSVQPFLIKSLEDERQQWFELKNAPPWEQ